MTVARVPHIVVLKPVHVHLQIAVSVDVHVGNEELCDTPSIPLRIKS